jgi:NADPH:quinone reductase
MKAVVVQRFGGPEVLEYVTLPDPVPSANQVLIKVEARSVNFADIKARQGKYHRAGEPPFVPGLDAAGTVVETGKDVTEFSVGDRVIGFPAGGSYGELALLEEVLTYHLPDSIDFHTAAAFPTVAVTAYQILRKVGQLEQGEIVAIQSAAGGVGTTAIQLAKHFGAGKIIAIVGSDEKIRIALEAGADYAINRNRESFSERVNELTEGKGADLILDSVSGDVFEQGLECLATFGRIVVFGHAAGKSGTFKTPSLHAKCKSVLGYSMGTTRALRPERLKNSVYEVIEFIETEKLKMVVSKKYPLSEASAAHSWIESRESYGKILLV